MLIVLHRRRIPSSLSRPAIDENRDRAVVHERDFHVRPEDSPARWLAEFAFQGGAKRFIQRLGNPRNRCPQERRAISLFRRGVQRELAYNDDFAPSLDHGSVHFSLLVGKNPQSRDLAAEPGNVLRPVSFFRTEQDEKAGLDSGNSRAIDFDGRLHDALDHGSHVAAGLFQGIACCHLCFGFPKYTGSIRAALTSGAAVSHDFVARACNWSFKSGLADNL
jgi:hypothetical protein